MISEAWQACLARCGELLAIEWTIGLLLVEATDRSASTYTLRTSRISSTVAVSECSMRMYSGWTVETRYSPRNFAHGIYRIPGRDHLLICGQY
jgi:hypothetical protein